MFAACVLLCLPLPGELRSARLEALIAQHCISCHDGATKKGGLDLEGQSRNLGDLQSFAVWVKVHDRVASGEMPPAVRKNRPSQDEVASALESLDVALTAADRARHPQRTSLRRLNRTEYEFTLRDLLHLPGLAVRPMLPEDGRAHGFDKTGSALELSAVQLAKYFEAAEHALSQATATTTTAPEAKTQRLYPTGQYDWQILLANSDAIFLKNFQYDPRVPLVSGEWHSFHGLTKAGLFRESGTVGVFRHVDDAFPGRFGFTASHPGRYRLRLSTWGFHWDAGTVKPNPRVETLAVIIGGRVIGHFDAPSLKPTEHTLEVWLNPGEPIALNPSSLWPVRVSEQKGRAAAYIGPGVAIDWIEVTGPLHERWPPSSHEELYNSLPDVEKQLQEFLRRAFRRPVVASEVSRYADLVRQRVAAGASVEESLRVAYKTALCSPDFLFLKNDALADRLAYFLWNSAPDETLLRSDLRDADVRRREAERLLRDPKADRFRTDFLDQWLDLRDIDATTPDARLYPEFRGDLRDAMLAESREYFRELIDHDLGIAHLVRSDFAMLNGRLAELYGVPGVTGSAIRRVPLPDHFHRGGFLTQAAILKVTANGTTTSPVRRGAWVLSKLLGRPPDPPPPGTPAVEPDVRGTVTIGEQLAKHRDQTACAACHARIDPPGFALEKYDVIGRYRDRYRSLGQGLPADRAPFPPHALIMFKQGPPVEAPGEAVPTIDDLRSRLAADERQLARNFVGQLIAYGTGAPVRYSDRPEVETILDRSKPGYGVRTLILEMIASPLFARK